jgi:hypothetical protein
MRVVILQSNYIPWKGYFDLIHDADIFVFYDEVKYTKNDWRNRNKIYPKNGLQWLTIPIEKDAVKKKISEVIFTEPSWQAHHHKTLELGYRNASHYGQLEPIIDHFYKDNKWAGLSELNQAIIKYISDYLDIQTKFIDSKDLVLEGDRVERLIHILKQLGATEYITGPAAKDYMGESSELFSSNNIKLTYKNYSGYPEYPQFKNIFEHGVSILDLIAHIEKDKISNYIWKWRAK